MVKLESNKIKLGSVEVKNMRYIKSSTVFNPKDLHFVF